MTVVASVLNVTATSAVGQFVVAMSWATSTRACGRTELLLAATSGTGDLTAKSSLRSALAARLTTELATPIATGDIVLLF